MKFWPFLAVNNFFSWVLKNTDQKNIGDSIVLKVKTEKKLFKNIVWPPKVECFWVLKQKPFEKIFIILFFCFSFKNNRHTHAVLVSIFDNAL